MSTLPSNEIVDDPPPSRPIAATAPRSAIVRAMAQVVSPALTGLRPSADDEEETSVRELPDRRTRVPPGDLVEREVLVGLPDREPVPDEDRAASDRVERALREVGDPQAHRHRRPDRRLGQQAPADAAARLQHGAAAGDRGSPAAVDGHDRPGQVGPERGGREAGQDDLDRAARSRRQASPRGREERDARRRRDGPVQLLEAAFCEGTGLPGAGEAKDVDHDPTVEPEHERADRFSEGGDDSTPSRRKMPELSPVRSVKKSPFTPTVVARERMRACIPGTVWRPSTVPCDRTGSRRKRPLWGGVRTTWSTTGRPPLSTTFRS